MQEAGLKVKEYELLRRNFSDSGNFGGLPRLLPGPLCMQCLLRASGGYLNRQQ